MSRWCRAARRNVLTHQGSELRGTGDLGVVLSVPDGRVLIVEHTNNTRLEQIEGALATCRMRRWCFRAMPRFAYVFGRDGGLTKVDLLSG